MTSVQNTPPALDVPPEQDDGKVSRQQWRWTALAGMASYLDAGSIVAISSGLALFQTHYGLSDNLTGALTAIGPNAIGAAIGAFIGGRLGDKLGRKRIYQYDLLLYAAAILLIAFSTGPVMLFAGTFLVGLAVGADVPTSLALVGEFSPAKARGRLLGFTQVSWSLGPVVVLLLAWALSGLGLLGIRIVFLSLFVVAVVTYLMRQGMVESATWKTAAASGAAARVRVRDLFSGPNLQAMLLTGGIYLFWNLAAGTNGTFTPYMIETLGAGSQATSVLLSCASFALVIVGSLAFYMRLADRSHQHRRVMWIVGSVMQVAAYGVFLFADFTIPVIIFNVVLFGIGQALAGEAVYKTYSQELFPTMLRGTAQGITFGTSRVILGIWSFFVPTLAATGITTVAAFLTVSLAICAVIGLFLPNTTGKSLEQVEAERSGARA
ncbi:MFS transporter [Allostreptomyces psammosilenae]|uniref:Inositol transporter-like SP family MFS transporter n=1 Tax=Allostreptomyces psammosilenae TaxID=1892865 RepID=A0A852ZT32_9ACTN|nr:MFS transporter [Allostreptomyces psammosilenae]NYI04687.1 inositol transporter-like SP family MFS transporter [Allostreptomyces psammosilenae]